MMNSKILIFLFVFLTCFSCKTDENKAKTNPIQKQTETKVNNKEKGTALSILEFRMKENNGNTYPIIEADTWEYKFVYDGDGMSPEGAYDGQWIDFKADHSYVYGENENIKGSGRYHYSLGKGLVVMVDSDVSKKAQEYEAKFAGDVMVLVGTATYGDNSYQMKLERIPDSTFPH